VQTENQQFFSFYWSVIKKESPISAFTNHRAQVNICAICLPTRNMLSTSSIVDDPLSGTTGNNHFTIRILK
jgi:hypothetical protein